VVAEEIAHNFRFWLLFDHMWHILHTLVTLYKKISYRWQTVRRV